ncbi:MAG: hypothetical protein KGO49_15375 [Gammaproteobacteria bacterium]|nr:hypothetical protein [Gammaproteobacteria bacterium]
MNNLPYTPRHPFAYFADRKHDFERVLNACQEFSRQRFKQPYSYRTERYAEGLVFNATPFGKELLACIQLAHRINRNFSMIELHPYVRCFLDMIYAHYAQDFVSGHFRDDCEVVVTAAVLNQFSQHLKTALSDRSFTSSLNRYPTLWKNDELAMSKMFKNWLFSKSVGMLNVVYLELQHIKIPDDVNSSDPRAIAKYMAEMTQNIIAYIKQHYPRGFLGGAYKLLCDPHKHMLGLFLGFNSAMPYCSDAIEIGKDIGQHFVDSTNEENRYLSHNQEAQYDAGLGVIDVAERHRVDYLMQTIHDFIYADFYASIPTNEYGGSKFGLIDLT